MTEVVPLSRLAQSIYVPNMGLLLPTYHVLKECERQDKKWGENRIQNGLLWNAILTEETGEAAKEVLEMDNEKLRAELVQVAAVALNWIKALDRREVPAWR